MLVLIWAPDLLPSGRLRSKPGSMLNDIWMPISEMFCHIMCRRSWRVRPPSASTARCQGQTSCGGAPLMPHHTHLTSLTLCTTTMARIWTPVRSPLTTLRCGDPLAYTTKDMNNPIYRCLQIRGVRWGQEPPICSHVCNVWLQGKVSHYAFVASAGAYKPNKVEPALTESGARKDSAGHVAVEKYLEEQVTPREFSHTSPSVPNRATHNVTAVCLIGSLCLLQLLATRSALCQMCLTMQLSFA
jgi:hypothetical protein